MKITLNDYQERTKETQIYGDVISNIEKGKETLLGLSYTALGLNGEAGEIADEIKKIIRNDKGELSKERLEKLVLELGDCLWYIAAMATELGFELGDVALLNLEKLRKRVERGFGG